MSRLIHDESLPDAIAGALEALKRFPGHEETLRAVEHAMDLATTRTPDADAVEQLGGGWIAEEAVAIALYCVLVSNSFEEAVLLAVNHTGDKRQHRLHQRQSLGRHARRRRHPRKMAREI